MASSAYEGLFCTICGAESGNTDLCIECAIRVERADERQWQYDDQADSYEDGGDGDA